MLTKEELDRIEGAFVGKLRKVLSDVEGGGGFTHHMQVDCSLDCLRGIAKCHRLKEDIK